MLREKYEQEMTSIRKEMNQQFAQIMSLIQRYPQLAYVKPDVLSEKMKRIRE
jgi:hypothetical protein